LDLGELLKEESMAINVNDKCQDGIPTPESILTDQELERIMDRSDSAYDESSTTEDRFALVEQAQSQDVLSNMR
jgi:hypothetical protein